MSKKVEGSYAHRSLAAKLGLKKESPALIINPPDDYTQLLGFEPKPATQPPFEFVQLFVLSQFELDNRLGQLADKLVPSGTLWLCWPKKTSHIETDLNETFIRKSGLAHGLVDVKVAAIDKDWSGQKFVYRLKDR